MKVKAPKEDPKLKSARESEERRSDAAFIENTSALLDEATRKNVRRNGTRGLRRPVVVTVGSGGGRGAGGGTGGGSYDPATGGSRPGLEGRDSGFTV